MCTPVEYQKFLLRFPLLRLINPIPDNHGFQAMSQKHSSGDEEISGSSQGDHAAGLMAQQAPLKPAFA
jgi:hypothetical protein